MRCWRRPSTIGPRQRQCENLLVPVCLSSTHAAFGSLRTEPVFMLLLTLGTNPFD